MPRVLTKRENGDAFFYEVVQYPNGDHREGGMPLGPNDVVDGKPVRDWPVGVYTVQTLEQLSNGGEREDGEGQT